MLLATLGWSLSGVFVRFMPGLDGFQLNCWRGFWTSVSLFFYLVFIYGKDTFNVFRQVPFWGLVTSAGFFAFGSTMYVTSLTLVSTAVISVIGATSPLFTGLLSPWATGERPGLTAWISASLAIAGVCVIGWDKLQAGSLWSLAVCLLVPFSFAAQTLALRRFNNVDMVPAICVGGMVSFLGAGFIGFLNRPGGGFDVPLHDVALLAAMGAVQLALPLVWYARGAKSVPAVQLSIIVMLDAVLNPFWPWLLVGEVPEPAAFMGGAIIIAAVLFSIFGAQVLRWRTA